jgi:hypothetical protein
MRAVRGFALLWMLVGLLWFSFVNTASAREVAGLAIDSFDSRPARSILFIGNSRTYPHDMPYMVREMADSAGAPEKYQIRMHALPGLSLKQHWQSAEVQSLLDRHWDDVVLQEMSAGQTTPRRTANFLTYGDRLADAIVAGGGRPLLFVGWNYGAELFDRAPPGTRDSYYRAIQGAHFRLASQSGAALANVGRVWRAVENANPSFRLDTDGNHPSLHGSYLTALVIYAAISSSDVARVSYVPDGLSQEDAALLRRLAANAI